MLKLIKNIYFFSFYFVFMLSNTKILIKRKKEIGINTCFYHIKKNPQVNED